MLIRVGWLLWGPSDVEAFPCCSTAAVPERAAVFLAMGNGWGALGQSRYCSPVHTAASARSHPLLLLRQQFCSEPTTHLQIYEEETHFLMKPGLEVVNLLAPKSQGPGQSHLVQLTCWQATGSPVAYCKALVAAPGTGLSMQPHVGTPLGCKQRWPCTS